MEFCRCATAFVSFIQVASLQNERAPSGWSATLPLPDYVRVARHPTGTARSVLRTGFESLRSSLPVFETSAGPIQDLRHGGFESLRSSLPVFETSAGPIQDLRHGQKHVFKQSMSGGWLRKTLVPTICWC